MEMFTLQIESKYRMSWIESDKETVSKPIRSLTIIMLLMRLSPRSNVSIKLV